MSLKNEVVVDCRGHLGRLCSVIGKEILNGKHVTCVRAEDMNMSDSLCRAKLKYAKFRRNHTKSNPRHQRAPSKILWRTVRGMVPHKTPRGAAALDRLKCFEGVPHPYDRKKRMVISQVRGSQVVYVHLSTPIKGVIRNKTKWTKALKQPEPGFNDKRIILWYDCITHEVARLPHIG